MPLEIVRNDITHMNVDAIVNAANSSLLGGGGVDGAIHKAAGPRLLDECRTLGGCAVGQAKITKGYDLPSKYIIHTVGPMWKGGKHGEPELLASCYQASLELAREHRLETVAFPLISSGVYGYPKDQALKIAVDTIGSFLLKNDMTVYIVIFDRPSFEIGGKLFKDISEYIDDVYAKEHTDDLRERSRRQMAEMDGSRSFTLMSARDTTATELDEMFDQIDEGFAQALFRLIDERDMTDVECYKRANIDRKLFSKIKSNPHYQPSKPTVLAFAISLKLSRQETDDLLMKAGFALSHSSKFDIIVEYCITHGVWDIHEVNEVLFSFDQSLLGSL